MAVWIGGIPKSVTHEVECQHGNDHDKAGNEQPGSQCKRLDILRLLQQHAQTDRQPGRDDKSSARRSPAAPPEARGEVERIKRDGERRIERDLEVPA